MTKKQVRDRINEAIVNHDYCLNINGFYISLEEFCPVCSETTLYIYDGININYDDIQYIK
jgi:hypothetical protein